VKPSQHRRGLPSIVSIKVLLKRRAMQLWSVANGAGTSMIVKQKVNTQSLSSQFDGNIFGTADLKPPERLDSDQ